MNESPLNGKILLNDGWHSGPALGAALAVAEELARDQHNQADILVQLRQVRQAPQDFAADAQFGSLAELLLKLSREQAEKEAAPKIREEPVPHHIWGDAFEDYTLDQLNHAIRLPISHSAALMPDGHPGYGLPIGGVLATKNAVIPYGVGMDIACRLRLSIFEEPPNHLNAQRDRLKKALQFNTRFGLGKRDGEWQPERRREHWVLDDERWQASRMLRSQHDKAVKQLGTSGTSNHFAEWCALTVLEDMPSLGIKAGETRLCFVTHSGSRGVGGSIAQEYTRIARAKHPHLPKAYQELAWLDLDSEAGQAYWLAMNLAGDFASANHEVIHETVLADAGLKPISFVENHHNFAWRETHGSEELIVHRKGATPAGKDVLGVIPGTMADQGYIVVGLGNEQSLNSSSHGAGRPRSRTATKQMFTRHQRDTYLKERGVELLNPDAGVDEAPQAYKDPAAVMSQQLDLVRPIATFQPLMVMMASDDKFGGGRRKGKGKRKR